MENMKEVIFNFEGHEMSRDEDYCPFCGHVMDNVALVGWICWKCYDDKNKALKSHENQTN